MSESVYTYGDISISPYKFEKILNLKIVKELNNHSKLQITGIIPEEAIDEYVEYTDDNEKIEVSLKNKASNTILFKGIVTSISVQATSNVRKVEIEALSSTFLMDVKKKTRSFQNKSTTYKEIFTKLTNEYPGAQVIDEASNGKSIGGLLMQYNETDWEFIKRLASHFNAPLIPDSKIGGGKYYIGIPKSGNTFNLDEFNYSVKKDLKSYKIKSENHISSLNENDLISYEIYSNKVLDLCSKVNFKQRSLYVYKAEIEIQNSVFLNKYELREMKGIYRNKLYNYQLTGVSLFGKILDVSKDTVKIELEVDKKQSKSGAMWFPYSTVYSSPDGSGWYCMPEIGDKVRLCFSDQDEKNAFAASSVNLSSSKAEKRSDPAVKSIGNKYGKEVVFKEGAVEIIGNGQLLVRLTDDGGIEINSNKKIVLSAEEDIEINGGGKILIEGKEGVDLTQASTNLKIKDNVTISGSKVNIE